MLNPPKERVCILGTYDDSKGERDTERDTERERERERERELPKKMRYHMIPQGILLQRVGGVFWEFQRERKIY